nr:unnamed protein product [Haemonchus contortus]
MITGVKPSMTLVVTAVANTELIEYIWSDGTIQTKIKEIHLRLGEENLLKNHQNGNLSKSWSEHLRQVAVPGDDEAGEKAVKQSEEIQIVETHEKKPLHHPVNQKVETREKNPTHHAVNQMIVVQERNPAHHAMIQVR